MCSGRTAAFRSMCGEARLQVRRGASDRGNHMTMQKQGEPKPGGLGRVWRGWKAIARKIGDFQARAILIFLYFVPFAPFALAVKWGTDPMATKQKTPKGWRPVRVTEPAAEAAARQF